MANEGNLKKFSSENQPANRGRKKGSRNRSTVLKKWLGVKTELSSPLAEGKKGTAEDGIILALIAKAQSGDVPAIREIQDTLYGKLTDKTEHSFDLSNLSDEEVLHLASLLEKLNP